MRESARECHLGDVRVAEDFEAGFGKMPAQRRQHRQREDKVPNGAAADHENFAFVHRRIVSEGSLHGGEFEGKPNSGR